MRLSRLCVTALLGLTVSGTSVLAEQNAWAANDGIPATLNGAFDGTYEIIFFGNMIGGLSYVYYDTATHVGWTQGTMADPASCGFYPSCYGFLVGSPVTAWYNPNGSGIHVAYLYNVPGTEHGQTWATLSEFEGGPLDWNYSDTGGDDGDLSADGAIPAAQVARGQINGQNALFLSSTTSLTNLFHDNTGAE